METISIQSKEKFSIDSINYLLSMHWRVEGAGKDRLVIQEQGHRVYVYTDTSDEGDGPGNRLLVDYSNLDLVKKVVEVIADNRNLVVDNDFGTVLPGDQFVTKIRQDRNWDWRKQK